MRVSGRPADSEVVWYAAKDYAGFWRRTLIELVDAVTLLVLLVILKRSRFKTLGYRLARARVVFQPLTPTKHR